MAAKSAQHKTELVRGQFINLRHFDVMGSMRGDATEEGPENALTHEKYGATRFFGIILPRVASDTTHPTVLMGELSVVVVRQTLTAGEATDGSRTAGEPQEQFVSR